MHSNATSSEGTERAAREAHPSTKAVSSITHQDQLSPGSIELMIGCEAASA